MIYLLTYSPAEYLHVKLVSRLDVSKCSLKYGQGQRVLGMDS